jgi:malonate transporter
LDCPGKLAYAGGSPAPEYIMLSLLLIVLPIFALIAAGWATRKAGIFGDQAASELNRFVVYLALPALLFDIMAKARWAEIWQPGYIGAFGLGALLMFVAGMALRLRPSHPLPDAAVDGLNAAYANIGFIGFPLAATTLGKAALAPTLIATIFTVCVLFAGALVLIEVGSQAQKHPLRVVVHVGRSLAKNPLLIAPALGAIFMAAGIDVPAPLDKFMTLLGGAASPCALVAMGLFLAQPRTEKVNATGAVALLVGLKLLGQPLATWALALWVFHLPMPLTHAAVLMATLPTGTGPFMAAQHYRRDAAVTSQVVLTSTILSVATITLYLSIISR